MVIDRIEGDRKIEMAEGYGAVGDHAAVIDNINAGNLPSSRADINSIIKYAESGEWSWKLLGAIGGIAMISSGFINFIDVNGFSVLLDFYIMLFGILSITVEFKEAVLPEAWVQTLRVDAKFMYKPMGRGEPRTA